MPTININNSGVREMSPKGDLPKTKTADTAGELPSRVSVSPGMEYRV